MPLALIPVPVAPAPPAPGAPLVLPAPFVLSTLLVAYNEPVPATTAARRAAVASLVGVRLCQIMSIVWILTAIN
ncbi:hypothetical protein B0H14DRAFT_2836094 [Mycena olivaceomarginata]|nr:hypothetical protein B0H14DRAFT_2836094 [Mycena olivaceomarginata]